MTICMAYEMKAMTSPTCMSPAETDCEPNHTIVTVIAFIRNIMSGSMSAMAWLVKSCVAMSSEDAPSKRSSSCAPCQTREWGEGRRASHEPRG